MDLVTITDHDSIAGALEIMHHGPHVFLSEEITARFPDNGCVAHVLAYDITESHHENIQLLRYNIYDLVAFLRAEGIIHSLAHPLSAINNRLTTAVVEKMFLLFNNMEVLNGPRDAYHYHTLRKISDALTREKLELWANKHDIMPMSWEPARHWTGGSDDHSGHTIARSFTIFEGEKSLADLKRAIAQGKTEVRGDFMTPESLSHTIYAGALNYFKENNYSPDTNVYHAIRTSIANKELPDESSLQHAMVKRLFDAIFDVTIKEGMTLPSAEDILLRGNTEALHTEIYAIARRILNHTAKEITGNLVGYVKEFRFSEAIYEIPALGELIFLSIPYLIGFRYFYNDCKAAQRVVRGLDVIETPSDDPRVAIFTDTIDSVNGVSLSLRRLADQLNESGHFVKILGLEGPQRDAIRSKAAGEDHIVRFKPLQDFPLFAYDDMSLGIPPFLAILEYVVNNRITLLQVSTPGPMGLAALLISKLLGIRVVGNYHTQVPEYAESLTNDPTVGRIVRGFVRWFYGAVEQVIVATNATRDYLVQMGIRPERIKVVPRGVDVEQFNPKKRKTEMWQQYGLNGSAKLLYVGRVSKEKNIDHLMSVYDMLRQDGTDVDLAIVGDGPYREELEDRHRDDKRIVFTGFLEGPQLSEAYASADLFVFPSTTDTFGNVVLEALASGLPAIVTDMGGPSEILEHNRTGYIVPAGNLSAYKRTIKKVIEDPECLTRMSTAARHSAESRCYRSAAQALWHVYHQTLAEVS
jgi:glycosyltransferase involved in cell wall biosynthesis